MNEERKQRIARLREYFDGHPFGSEICRDVQKTCDDLEKLDRPSWLQRFFGLS